MHDTAIAGSKLLKARITKALVKALIGFAGAIDTEDGTTKFQPKRGTNERIGRNGLLPKAQRVGHCGFEPCGHLADDTARLFLHSPIALLKCFVVLHH